MSPTRGIYPIVSNGKGWLRLWCGVRAAYPRYRHPIRAEAAGSARKRRIGTATRHCRRSSASPWPRRATTSLGQAAFSPQLAQIAEHLSRKTDDAPVPRQAPGFSRIDGRRFTLTAALIRASRATLCLAHYPPGLQVLAAPTAPDASTPLTLPKPRACSAKGDLPETLGSDPDPSAQACSLQGRGLTTRWCVRSRSYFEREVYRTQDGELKPARLANLFAGARKT